MDLEYTIDQLELHNSNYEWIINESEKILCEIDELDDSDRDSKKYDMLVNKLKELQIRFNKSKSQYNELFEHINKYFEDKYGITFEPLEEQ